MTSLLLLMAASALAEDSEFAGAEVPPEEAAVVDESETTLSAELGGLASTGNIVLWSVNGGAAATHKWDANKLSFASGLILGEAISDANGDGVIDDAERDVGLQPNARRVFGEARYDRFVTDNDSIYVLAGAFHDPYAGYRLRSHEQIGYSRLLLKNDTTELRGELGFDYAQELYLADVDPDYANIFAARILLAGTHNFSESVGISDVFEVYENVVTPEDVRILNTFAFSAAINSTLSLKLSHALIFDNVPVEGFRPLDQTTAVTLVASIL